MYSINHDRAPYHYLDNASTTFPKPQAVIKEMNRCLRDYGVNPGRGSHQIAKQSEAILTDAKKRFASLFCNRTPQQIVFTQNATYALNLVLNGVLNAGDHVVTTNFEHNSVLRPLARLVQERGVEVTTVFSDEKGIFNLQEIEQAINANTKLVVINHASNVLGVRAPVEKVLQICKAYGIPMLLDASQTIGLLDLKDIDADFIAFTGHKGLYAPPGTGGLVMRDPESVRQMVVGGTGESSHSLIHPQAGEGRFEAGTQNYVGLAGLGAALSWIESKGRDHIFAHEMDLLDLAIETLSEITEVEIYGDVSREVKIPLLSFNVKSSLPLDVAKTLDEQFNVQVRAGLHCAPLIHQTIGTFPHGAIRISFSFQNSEQDVLALVRGIKAYCFKHKKAFCRGKTRKSLNEVIAV